MPTLEDLVAHVDSSLLKRSGGLLYSGRAAFSGTRDLYVLGHNPGGAEADGEVNSDGEEPYSIRLQIAEAIQRPEALWSAYLNESWKGYPPGKHSMQLRVLHLLEGLQRDPRETPASNLIFVRSRRASEIQSEQVSLTDQCWAFHKAVIAELGVRVIACFGEVAGTTLREKLGAHVETARFREHNDRQWTSVAHQNSSEQIVVTLSHPSRSDWRTPECDPTELVRRSLAVTAR